MKPVFDKNGLATEPGEIRCFYYDPDTGEYTGWSDEYINPGVSMPGHSTDIDPGDEVAGKVAVYKNVTWSQEEDHRGEIVYSTTDGMKSTIDYIGSVHDGYTTTEPSGPYDKWDGEKWVTDTDAQHAADVKAADQQKAALLTEAKETISFWQTELQLGIISDEDKASLIAWMNYIKAVQAVDTSKAPDITWPTPPAA
ncbi:TPA: tail fiber assembly protein [Enterobacter chengduensis]|uniref:tail fiber assembly protein n=1 Tax=Enterobacter cloacae complex TaxID=354276 RepID=UPI00097C02A2|nr:tail fiber assembly protein [Enterobacter chengduensis]GJL43867.1 tail assembly protein [Enterobacter asburiae]MCK7171585.1 tail fiber assembly protein [Enterobacter chengduensis]MCM8033609.1 tail fiber assembly protein [Enterobacter chengduensis]QEL34889.1 tail fiber assembly protein [Enterobacter chengduensis]HCD3310244.1 tail fiber assembly protein [Enterobacter chengduensis]